MLQHGLLQWTAGSGSSSFPPNGGGCVAYWIRRQTSSLEIAGSSRATVVSFLKLAPIQKTLISYTNAMCKKTPQECKTALVLQKYLGSFMNSEIIKDAYFGNSISCCNHSISCSVLLAISCSALMAFSCSALLTSIFFQIFSCTATQ